MSLLVRPATEQDVAEITRIYGHYVLHTCATFELEAPGRDEMERRRREILESGLPYLAGENDGRVVGYAYANAYRPRAAYRLRWKIRSTSIPRTWGTVADRRCWRR